MAQDNDIEIYSMHNEAKTVSAEKSMKILKKKKITSI